MTISKADQMELDILLLVKGVLYNDFNHALFISLCYLKYREQQYGETCLPIDELKEMLIKGRDPFYSMLNGFDDETKQYQSTPPLILNSLKLPFSDLVLLVKRWNVVFVAVGNSIGSLMP